MKKGIVLLSVCAATLGGILSGVPSLRANEQLITTNIKGYFELDLHNDIYSVTDDVVSFREHQAVIFINPMIGDKIRGMYALSVGYGGRDIELWNAYVDYIFRPEFTFRFGVDLTPVGGWERERISIHERDMRIRPNVLYKGLFPHQVMGAYALGVIGTGQGDLSYRIGIVNNEDTVNKQLQLREDSESQKTTVGRIGFDTTTGLGIGVSGYVGDRFTNKVKQNSKVLYGMDLFYRWERLKLNGEYIGAAITPVVGDAYKGGGYYAQVGYMVHDKVTVAYRYDVNDTNDTAISDNMNEGTENIVSLSYRPETNLVYFIDYRMHKTEKGTEKNKFILSLGFTF